MCRVRPRLAITKPIFIVREIDTILPCKKRRKKERGDRDFSHKPVNKSSDTTKVLKKLEQTKLHQHFLFFLNVSFYIEKLFFSCIKLQLDAILYLIIFFIQRGVTTPEVGLSATFLSTKL